MSSQGESSSHEKALAYRPKPDTSQCTVGGTMRVSGADITRLSQSTLKQLLEAQPDTSKAPSPKSFACPFYRINPKLHWKCLRDGRGIQEINNLIEHISYKHRQVPHCPRCHATFKDTPASDAHIRSRTCTVRSEPMEDWGLLYQEDAVIASLPYMYDENNINMAPEVQWYCIWSLILPGRVVTPAEVYLGASPFETLVCTVHDFWQQHGEAVVFDFGVPGAPAPSKEVEAFEGDSAALNRAVLHRMLEELHSVHTGDTSGLEHGPPCEAAKSLIALFNKPSPEN